MFKKILLIISVVFVSSCLYTPDNFNADVIIDSAGKFSMAYDGDLIRVPYVQELRNGKVKPEDIQDKIEAIKKDLKRDNAFTEITSKGQGRFKVKYKRTGLLRPDLMLTFIRRDSIIFSVKTSEKIGSDYEVAFKGRYISKNKQNQLLELDVHINGIFRFATNAEVINHNAMRVMQNPPGFGGGTIYEWTLKDFNNPPHLVLKLRSI